MPKKEPLYPHIPKSRAKETQVEVIETGNRDWYEPGIHLKNPSPQQIEDAKEEAINKGFNAVYVHLVPEAKETDIEIERYHGIIVAVGGINTKTPSLPDWDISYVEYPPGQMEKFRGALMKARVNIVKVTDLRIYFSQ